MDDLCPGISPQPRQRRLPRWPKPRPTVSPSVGCTLNFAERERQALSPAALGATQPLPGPCPALPRQAEPYSAPPCQAVPGAFRSTAQALPCHTTPSQASISMPCYATPCRSSSSSTFSISGSANCPNMPLFSGRQSPSPIWRPAMSNHSSSWLRSISSSSTATLNVQEPGRVKPRPRAENSTAIHDDRNGELRRATKLLNAGTVRPLGHIGKKCSAPSTRP